MPIVRKQLNIMPTYHYVKNQGKLMMQSQGQISPNWKLFWKIGFIQIEGNI